jgi:hypothetical protein
MNNTHLPDIYFSLILNVFFDLMDWQSPDNQGNAREIGMANRSNPVTDRPGHFNISMLCEKLLQIGTIHRPGIGGTDSPCHFEDGYHF